MAKKSELQRALDSIDAQIENLQTARNILAAAANVTKKSPAKPRKKVTPTEASHE